tara:strand:+ start:1235 stop:1705 length:471 start_codon:yes stop_codon:yes gene_type:complete
MGTKTGCKDKISRTCGKKINAKCVDYEGSLHDNTTLATCDCHSVEDVIEDMNLALNEINTSIDLTILGDDCITYDEVDGKIQVKEALKKLEECICELKAKVDDVDAEDCPAIFSADISCLGLNFECLETACETPIQNLGELLQALITQTCANVVAP